MLLTKLNFVCIIISLKLAYLLGHDYSLYLLNHLKAELIFSFKNGPDVS